ncbi:hypothetical protein Adt_35076 [Abeliophyllum distichum]|uniref:Uncharacterized protein n=1 Tax=Abeliophyllum distichum TaxID=126358 RepID=A0ABD1QDP8_9LAMI
MLGPTTWDSVKLQLDSSLTSKEHHLTASSSHLGLGQTTAWLLPYVQGALPRCLALPSGTRPNCILAPSLPPLSIASLAPPLPPRRITSLLDPPTLDLAELQLGFSLTSKEHRLAAGPNHMGLGQTTAWLHTYLQGVSPRCLALPLGTQPNCSLAPPLPPKSITSMLGPTTWDSVKALPPWTWLNYSLAVPLPPRSIDSLLGHPTWDSTKLQLGSSLTSKEHRLASWPSQLGLSQTAAWLLPYLRGASARYLAIPYGTRPNYSLAPSLPPRSIASLLGPHTWNSAKLQLGSSLTSKEHRLAAWPSYLGLGLTAAWLLPYL